MENIIKNIVNEAWTNIVRLENLQDKMYDIIPENTRIELVDYVTMSIIDAGNIIADCYNIDISEENMKYVFDNLLEDAAKEYREKNNNANIEKLELPDHIHDALLKFPMDNQKICPNTNGMWVVFETCDPNSNHIHDYDAMATFKTEQDAIKYEMENPDYRTRKYVKITHND